MLSFANFFIVFNVKIYYYFTATFFCKHPHPITCSLEISIVESMLITFYFITTIPEAMPPKSNEINVTGLASNDADIPINTNLPSPS